MPDWSARQFSFPNLLFIKHFAIKGNSEESAILWAGFLWRPDVSFNVFRQLFWIFDVLSQERLKRCVNTVLLQNCYCEHKLTRKTPGSAACCTLYNSSAKNNHQGLGQNFLQWLGEGLSVIKQIYQSLAERGNLLLPGASFPTRFITKLPLWVGVQIPHTWSQPRGSSRPLVLYKCLFKVHCSSGIHKDLEI